ncbi:hypothetical protein ACLOJK_000830 [Asimina triloba]
MVVEAAAATVVHCRRLPHHQPYVHHPHHLQARRHDIHLHIRLRRHHPVLNLRRHHLHLRLGIRLGLRLRLRLRRDHPVLDLRRGLRRSSTTKGSRGHTQFKKKITSDPLHITQTWVGTDVCNVKGKGKYKGFYCAKAPDKDPSDREALAVAAVDFNSYNLSADSVEEFVEGLNDTAFFHANSNRFKGALNIDFTKLPFFYELDVSNNLITAPFPTSVLTLNLTFLDLRFNFFSGPVPPQVFLNYKYVEVIFLNNNAFSQSIPDAVGNTPAQYLTFANNQFTGGIPRSIKFLADNLLEVLFLNNKLSGCIPYEVGLLAKAVVFDAGYNRLTGPIPFSLGCLDKIEQLNFAGNLLYGQIPELVCKLGRLQNLSLSDNYFTSVGPACRNLIKRGILHVRKNCIFGLPNQRHPSQCTAFFSKPLQCHVPANYLKIPCGKKPSSSSFVAAPPYSSAAWAESLSALPPSSTAEMTRSAEPSPSPSYAALTPQHG